MPSLPTTNEGSSTFRARLLRAHPDITIDVTSSYFSPISNISPHHYILRPNSGFQSPSLHLDPKTGALLAFMFFAKESEHQNGFAHGGAVAAIFDAIAAFTGKKYSEGARVWTRVHETRFLKPVPTLEDYGILARIKERDDNDKRIKLNVRCELIDKTGEILSESDTIVLVMKGVNGKAIPTTKL